MTGEFLYRPIPSDHIRLLFLSFSNSKHCGKLEIVPLTHPSEYTALSYCWGIDRATQSFECAGKPFAVSQNLFDALQQLARRSPGHIWIDAICIDQSNDGEKAIQVPQMGRIYANAVQVIVWHGKAKSGVETQERRATTHTNRRDYFDIEDSDLAMEAMPVLAKDLTTMPSNESLLEDRLRALGLPKADERVWCSIRDLFSRPWFSRLWVVQEVILARKILLWCGDKSIEFSSLSRLCSHMNRLGLPSFIQDRFGPSDGGFRLMVGMPIINHTFKATSKLSISAFMHISRRKNVTEPIDHVYGLLGLLGPQLSQMIRIDYSPQSRGEYWHSFVDLAKCYMTVDPDLGLLSHATSRFKQPHLPSWVPNLASAAVEYQNFDTARYRAGISSSNLNSNKPLVIVDHEKNHLKISGFRLDCVDRIVAPVYDHSMNPKTEAAQTEQSTLLNQWEKECKALSQQTYGCDQNEIPEAHWRALIADLMPAVGKGFPADPEMKEHYLAYIWMIRLSIGEDKDQEQNQDHKENDTEWENSQLAFGQNYLRALIKWADHSYFSTTKGRIGRGPRAIRTGDVVCVLYSGGPVFLLRYEPGSDVATLVGDAFVHDCMDLDLLPAESRGQDEVFIIG